MKGRRENIKPPRLEKKEKKYKIYTVKNTEEF